MIHKLTKPVALYRAYRINLNKHRKIKKLTRAMEYGTMGTLAAMQTGYMLRQPVVEQFIKTTTQKSDLVITTLPKEAESGTIPFTAAAIDSFRDSLLHIKTNFITPVSNYVLKPSSINNKKLKKQIILKIMNDDKSLPQNLNKNKMAETILNVSNELGVDPIILSCIIKKETHFKSGLDGKGAKGLMQITGITIKDMYQKGRDKLYHSALNDIKKDYPTSSSLFGALQTNDSINIKIGAMVYMMKLAEAKGNMFNALKKYNASSTKESYAREVLANIKKYTAEYENLKKAKDKAV